MCEQAEALVEEVLAQHTLVQDGLSLASCELQKVDIVDDPELLERYAIRIPVLVQAGRTEELGWPFDGEQLRRYLARGGESA